jgi:hypothetical protein
VTLGVVGKLVFVGGLGVLATVSEPVAFDAGRGQLLSAGTVPSGPP